MGQAKNRGTREQRVANAEQRETAARVGAALAGARKREALAQAARDDLRDPPARAVVVGGISPRMRLALAGLARLADAVGTLSTTTPERHP